MQSLALAVFVAALSLFSLASTARSELLSYSFTPRAIPTTPYLLNSFDSVAVWGTDGIASQGATFSRGWHINPSVERLNNPTLISVGLSDPRWTYNTGFATISGALSTTPNFQDNLEGFRLTLFPDDMPERVTNYQVLFQPMSATALVTIRDQMLNPLGTLEVTNQYGSLNLSASQWPLYVDIQKKWSLGNGSIRLGMANATVQAVAVPEPECLLTVGLIAPILVWATRRRMFSEQANPSP